MTTATNVQRVNNQSRSKAHCGQCKSSWCTRRRRLQECPACGSGSMEYIAGIVELDGEPDASSSIMEEPNSNNFNDTHGWESLISGIAERVLGERLSAAETGGFVLRGLDEAMGHMFVSATANTPGDSLYGLSFPSGSDLV